MLLCTQKLFEIKVQNHLLNFPSYDAFYEVGLKRYITVTVCREIQLIMKLITFLILKTGLNS